MSDPEFVTQLIGSIVDQRDSSVTSILIAATPSPKIYWVSLQGTYDKVVEHRSNDPEVYPVSISLVVLKPEVNRYLSRATVTLGMFRLLNEAKEWKTWKIENVRVHEDLRTHEVKVEFDLSLKGDAVAAGSFNYTADLYLGF